jgi:hypothetical protein
VQPVDHFLQPTQGKAAPHVLRGWSQSGQGGTKKAPRSLQYKVAGKRGGPTPPGSRITSTSLGDAPRAADSLHISQRCFQ